MSTFGLSLSGVKPAEPQEKGDQGLGPDVVDVLRDHGIQPSAQRVAVAKYVLRTEEHPSADQVWHNVRSGFPMLSRATVYNTLNLFVEKGLLREFILAEGRLVYDPKTEPHHHFIDDVTGKIHDVPWDAVQVSDVRKLPGFAVRDYQVVMRGQKLPSA
ncbi:transcriptional repressor [Pendulispora brunnea]|uniref:Transcriptional repressor n=1 Tax=Pendulispora brunnea TaxID=2905690 RepID=A0ABZ2KI97_9BACT